MCGRYQIELTPKEIALYEKLPANFDQQKGEVFPSLQVPTYGANDQQIRLALTSWGFTMANTKQLLINARSETLLEKPTFAPHFKSRRCLFPMTGFFEWDQKKQRYLFTDPSSPRLFVAGLYRLTAEKVESIILTTQPNNQVAPIHNRMPLLISSANLRNWLTDEKMALELLQEPVKIPLEVSQLLD